jgi:hypothetical protein
LLDIVGPYVLPYLDYLPGLDEYGRWEPGKPLPTWDEFLGMLEEFGNTIRPPEMYDPPNTPPTRPPFMLYPGEPEEGFPPGFGPPGSYEPVKPIWPTEPGPIPPNTFGPGNESWYYWWNNQRDLIMPPPDN